MSSSILSPEPSTTDIVRAQPILSVCEGLYEVMDERNMPFQREGNL